MKRIAMVCPAVTGHLNPTTAVGCELRRRGHQVSVISLVDALERVRSTGLEFIPFGAREFPAGSVIAMTQRLGELDRSEALRLTVDHYRREAIALLKDFAGLQQRSQFDALVVDQTMPGLTLAQETRLPFVTLCNALALNPEPTVPPWSTTWPYDPSPEGVARNLKGYDASSGAVKPVLDAVKEHRRSVGLEPLPLPTAHQRAGDSPLAIISQQSPSFDFPRAHLPDHFHYAGPFVSSAARPSTPFPFERLDGRPLVYASLGTLQNRLEWVLRPIAEAVSKLPMQLVLTLGRTDAIAPADLPGDPLVVSYAPQLELLRRASLVISHAGLNTVMESLSEGIPIVAIPITNDQPGVAARLVHTGAGMMVSLDDLNAERLKATLVSVFESCRFREQAKAMQEEIRELGGAVRAADLIETAIESCNPVLRNEP